LFKPFVAIEAIAYASVKLTLSDGEILESLRRSLLLSGWASTEQDASDNDRAQLTENKNENLITSFY
jgi:hypothetical protein